jgi:hypothetical protein
LGGEKNSYTGGTKISAGVLEVRGGTPLGSGTVEVSGAASLVAGAASGTIMKLANNLSGAGSLEVNGKGTVELQGTNTLAGGVTLTDGSLNVSSAKALGAKVALNGGVLGLTAPVTVSVPVTVSGSVAVNVSGNTEITGVLSGADAGAITRLGSGALKVGEISVTSGVFTATDIDSSAAGLTKTGDGILLWTGIGNVTGVSAVTAGTLVVGGTQTLTGITKKGAGLMVLAQNSTVQGAKMVLQEGTLAISNNASVQNVGTLTIGGPKADGALDSSNSVLDVTAVPGGLVIGNGTAQTLKGRGQIKGAVTLAANTTLAPGNSIDTISISSLRLLPGVKFEAEYQMQDGTVTSDRLIIAGGTELLSGGTGGTVVPKLFGTGRITDFNKHNLPIVTAAGGWGQRFDNVVSTAVLRSSLEYFDVNGVRIDDPLTSTILAGSVNMVLERVPFKAIGARGYRAETGRGLDLAMESADKTLGALIDTISTFTTEAEVISVIDQLNPRVFAEVYSLALNRIQDVQKTVSDRLTSLGAASSGVGGPADVLAQGVGADGGWTAWTNAYVSSRAKEARANEGDGGSSNTSVGNVTGVERVFGKLTLGFMGGVGTGTTQLNTPNSKVTSDSWHLGIYMSAPLTTRVFADTMMVFGEGDNEIRRSLTLPVMDSLGNVSMTSLNSRTRSISHEWLVQLGLGAQLAAPGSTWSVIPSLRFAYAGVSQGAVTEKMDALNSLGIKSDAKTNGTVLMRSGIEIAKDGHLGALPLRSSANAAWVHDFFVDPRRLGMRWQGVESASWMINTERRSADALRLGAAFELGLGDRRTLRLYGEQEYLNSTKVFRGGVTFTIGF